MRTPVQEAFSNGIRTAYGISIVIQWSMTLCFIESQWICRIPCRIPYKNASRTGLRILPIRSLTEYPRFWQLTTFSQNLHFFFKIIVKKLSKLVFCQNLPKLSSSYRLIPLFFIYLFICLFILFVYLIIFSLNGPIFKEKSLTEKPLYSSNYCPSILVTSKVKCPGHKGRT